MELDLKEFTLTIAVGLAVAAFVALVMTVHDADGNYYCLVFALMMAVAMMIVGPWSRWSNLSSKRTRQRIRGPVGSRRPASRVLRQRSLQPPPDPRRRT